MLQLQRKSPLGQSTHYGWKSGKVDRNGAPNGIIELLNQPTLKPLPPACFVIFCQEVPIKAVEVGDLFVFRVLMNKNGLGDQTGRHPAIPPGRGFFLPESSVCG